MASSVQLSWWSRVDREAVIEAVRSLVRDPKALALVGDASSGLSEAASLAQEEFARLGRKCMRVSDLDVRLPTLKYRLLKLIDILTLQRAPTAYRPSLLLASAGLAVIRNNLSLELVALKPPPAALILDRIDAQEQPRRNEILELQELARISNTPIIVTGDSRYQWAQLLPSSSVLQLRGFTRASVRACLLSAPPLAGWENKRVEQLLDDLFPGGGRVSALEVFSRLKVLVP